MKKPRPRKKLSPELEELRVGLIGVLPKIGNELGSMLGRKFPRASARDRAGLERKLDQLMRATAPHIKTLEELKDKPDVDLERFVALDQFLTGLLKSAGQKLRPDADPWEAYLHLAAKQATPPHEKWAQSPVFTLVQQALWDFLVHLYTHARLRRFSARPMSGPDRTMPGATFIPFDCSMRHRGGSGHSHRNG